MRTEELKDIINFILEKKGGKTVEQLDLDNSLQSDLGFDSLDLAELTVRIEDAFGVDIYEDGLVSTVGEIVDKLK